MSHLDSILGLPDLSIERVKRGQIVEVWCKPKVRPACIHCQHDTVRIKSTYHRGCTKFCVNGLIMGENPLQRRNYDRRSKTSSTKRINR